LLKQFCLILAAIGAITGCAGQQPPKFEFPADTRVGIINQLEAYATHQNYQPIRIGDFTKNRQVNWDIPAYVENQLRRHLQNDPRYTVIPQNLAALRVEPATRDRITSSSQIEPEFAGLLEKLADQNDLDVIVWIKSFKGPSPFKIAKNPIELKGYGLFTRQQLLQKNAYAYANIEVIVLKTHPITYLSSGSAKIKDSPITDINLGDNLRNLPQSELDKLLPFIQSYADEAVDNALKNANLIPTI